MNTTLIVLANLVGCEQHGGIPAAPPPAASPTSPSTTPSLITPHVRIHGTAELVLAVPVTVIPAHGADRGWLWVPGVDSDPYALGLPGDLAVGEYTADEAWDGVSALRVGVTPPMPPALAGDTDGDGHLDVWVGSDLLTGPFAGRDVDPMTDRVAWLDSDPAGLEAVMLGDFDADEDGELDVITADRDGTPAFVRYGPFAGAVPSAVAGAADPLGYSTLASDAYGSWLRVEWLRDPLGSHDLVAIGGARYDIPYSYTTVWDPYVPPGTHLVYDDAVAWVAQVDATWPTVGVSDPGDVDGDGTPDLLAYDGRTGWLYPGPISGWMAQWGDPAMSVTGGYVSRGLPDLNGDGARELLGFVDDGTELIQGRLLCSPFTLPLEVGSGAPIEISGVQWGWAAADVLVAGDLDGDGLSELVASTLSDSGSRIDIFDGRDLLDGCPAH